MKKRALWLILLSPIVLAQEALIKLDLLKSSIPKSYLSKPKSFDTLGRHVLALAAGTTVGFSSKSIFKIEDGALYFNDENEKVSSPIEIAFNGHVLQSRFKGVKQSLFDSQSADVLNEKRKKILRLNLRGFSVNTHEVSNRPRVLKNPQMNECQKPLIVYAVGLFRNFETEEMGSKGFSSGDWDTLSMQLVPVYILSQYNTAPVVDFADPHFLYRGFNEDRRKIQNHSIVLRDSLGSFYKSQSAHGAYLNDKRETAHGLIHYFKNEVPFEAEWHGADTFSGAQIVEYEPGVEIQCLDYLNLNQDQTHVWTFRAGDGGAKRDDLVALLKVNLLNLKTGETYFYRQRNSLDGIDLLLVFGVEEK